MFSPNLPLARCLIVSVSCMLISSPSSWSVATSGQLTALTTALFKLSRYSLSESVTVLDSFSATTLPEELACRFGFDLVDGALLFWPWSAGLFWWRVISVRISIVSKSFQTQMRISWVN